MQSGGMRWENIYDMTAEEEMLGGREIYKRMRWRDGELWGRMIGIGKEQAKLRINEITTQKPTPL